MKKIFIVFITLIFILYLTGCKIKEKTELHSYTKPNVSYQIADILYEIHGDPTKLINGFYYKKNDIVLSIKYGWNEATIEYFLNSIYNSNQYELICFATYIYLERQPSNTLCDDYKNFEKSILIEEIDKDVFYQIIIKQILEKGIF